MRAALLALVLLLPLSAAVPDPVVSARETSRYGGLKQTVRVTVRGLAEWLKANNTNAPKYVLYLNGIAFPDLAISGPVPGHDDIGFFLDRTDVNRNQWATLLRDPVPVRTMPLTVGIAQGPVFKSEVDAFQLRVYNPVALYSGAALFLVLFGLFVWAARSSDILREAGAPPPAPARKAYSLSRVQMAVWFFVVAQSFVLLWIITFATDSIPNGVLALIGISTATGLAGAVVDGSKSGGLAAQRDQLLAERSASADPVRQSAIDLQLADINKQLATPVHVDFILDILSDANGVSFHRFQMAVWTLILAVIFAFSVWKDLLMPDFNATLLGLMGISSGTYIGFKFPESKN